MQTPSQSLQPISQILRGATEPIDWVIPQLIPQGYLMTLVGLAGSGKSTVSYTLAIALAAHLPFLSLWQATESKKVLYFDDENSRPDAEKYWQRAWNGLKSPDPSLLDQFLFFAPFLLGGKDWPTVMTMLAEAYHPHLIIIDTATPAFAIDDENSNAEANRHITRLRKLQAALSPRPAILVLKHAKLDRERKTLSIRGATAWAGAVDSVLFHVRSPGRPGHSGLVSSKLEPGKGRAYGLQRTTYITPSWTTATHDGLMLTGSFSRGVSSFEDTPEY